MAGAGRRAGKVALFEFGRSKHGIDVLRRYHFTDAPFFARGLLVLSEHGRVYRAKFDQGGRRAKAFSGKSEEAMLRNLAAPRFNQSVFGPDIKWIPHLRSAPNPV